MKSDKHPVDEAADKVLPRSGFNFSSWKQLLETNLPADVPLLQFYDCNSCTPHFTTEILGERRSCRPAVRFGRKARGPTRSSAVVERVLGFRSRASAAKQRPWRALMSPSWSLRGCQCANTKRSQFNLPSLTPPTSRLKMQTPGALRLVALAATASLSVMIAHSQLAGSNTAETHPTFTSQSCTSSGCTDEDTSIALDANWRWLHKEGTSTNCYTGNEWDKTICSDPKTCASTCALDGADYTGTYGITSESNSLTLKLVTKGPYSTNIGSRVYMMESDDTYKAYKLLNQEFTFDVDVSDLDCGLNGALYFVDMDTDGGKERFSGNKAGAKYGTGYCDAQCPQDLKFISGEANILNWTASATDSNSGTGNYGSCCAEMDIWASSTMDVSSSVQPLLVQLCVVREG